MILHRLQDHFSVRENIWTDKLLGISQLDQDCQPVCEILGQKGPFHEVHLPV